MVWLSSLCVLFILALSALSAPIPNPQVVTPGELTTPSQGGTFTDFKALPSTGNGELFLKGGFGK